MTSNRKLKASREGSKRRIYLNSASARWHRSSAEKVRVLKVLDLSAATPVASAAASDTGGHGGSASTGRTLVGETAVLVGEEGPPQLSSAETRAM